MRNFFGVALVKAVLSTPDRGGGLLQEAEVYSKGGSPPESPNLDVRGL